MEYTKKPLDKIISGIAFCCVAFLTTSCYETKDNLWENIYLISLIQNINSAEAESCGFSSFTQGTIMEDPFHDVQIQGTQEFLTNSAGYKDISYYELYVVPDLIWDITLRDIPNEGLPPFPNEPLNRFLSVYILDFFVGGESYTIELRRDPSSNQSNWSTRDSRPIATNNRTDDVFLCSNFPTVSNNTIRIGCDGYFFNFTGINIQARMQSIHKEGSRTFVDCR